MLIAQQGAAQNTDATWRVGDDHLSGVENMNPIEQVKNWAKDIVDLALVLIAFGVVVYIIFGPDQGWYFSTITQNLIGFINEIGSNSLAGIIALFVIVWCFAKRN